MKNTVYSGFYFFLNVTISTAKSIFLFVSVCSEKNYPQFEKKYIKIRRTKNWVKCFRNLGNRVKSSDGQVSEVTHIEEMSLECDGKNTEWCFWSPICVLFISFGWISSTLHFA